MSNKLTIIIPAFNEELGIRSTVEQLLPYAEKHAWKISVVNDGSSDNTLKELQGIKGVEVISHPYNKGYGASLKTGIKAANTDLIALYDADGQHRPEDLEFLVSGMENYDMVIGERGQNSHKDWNRKPGKWILSKTANFLTGRKIPDLNSGLRVIKREVITRLLHLFPDGFSFSTTSTIAFMNMGFNVGYLPIVVKKRVGKSSVKQIKHGSSTILLILRLIVLFNPLKVFIPVSLGLFGLGFIYEVVYGIILIPGIKILPAALLAFISSILIFFLGLVVDQISELRKHLEK
jgi:glycosyltransferase involved in cell wall biosynthesis